MRSVSIQVKIVSLIVAILIIMVTVALIYAVDSQRKSLLQATQNTLSVNTQILNTVIQNIMLSGEAPVAEKTMASIS